MAQSQLQSRSGLPLIVQAASKHPVFRGVDEDSQPVMCPRCRVVLIEKVSADAIFDLAIECAGCGKVILAPDRPPGRGLGGILHVVRRGHRAAGTFVMDMDEVIVGERSVRGRAQETGGDHPESVPVTLDLAAIQQIIDDARSTFAPIMGIIRPTKHRLARLIERSEENLADLQAGGVVVDVWSILGLARATGAFRRWMKDPSTSGLLEDSKDPNSFIHNCSLLQVGAMLEAARLGPEFVLTGTAKTPDLALRISASQRLQVDMKTPRSLQRPVDPPTMLKLDAARETIKKALRSSRGQFTTPGILVIAGDFWLGGIAAYAAEATKLLQEPLAANASAEARRHYKLLLGIMFASVGWAIEDRTYRSRLYLRWVPNPRYAGSVALRLSPEVNGPYTISLRPSDLPIAESGPHDDASFESDPGDRARFRLVGDEVEAEGAIARPVRDGATKRLTVFQFPDGYRPAASVDFDVACEGGFTVVTVSKDGALVADPSVGWIRLHGVRFKVARPALIRRLARWIASRSSHFKILQHATGVSMKGLPIR